MRSASIHGFRRLLGACLLAAHEVQAAEDTTIPWKACLAQKGEWYSTAEAARIGENVLLYQRRSGGWTKNIDMAAVLAPDDRARIQSEKTRDDATIDNGATCTQLAYLARLHEATKGERLREAFLRGLDFLLDSQYENGGWPQRPEARSGYQRHITFNDDAMTNVLRLLQDVAAGAPGAGFTGGARGLGASPAVEKGVQCILRCQVVVQGRRTAWCAQHDEKTLRPAPARAYEKESLSGSESVGIVELLMSLDRPGPEVVEAVRWAVAWLESARLTGIRQVKRPEPSAPKGYDTVIVEDPRAGPLWARFYEIGTNRPIFCGRDGVVKYRLAEIEYERRNGYTWYTDRPARLLAGKYPTWRSRWVDRKEASESEGR